MPSSAVCYPPLLCSLRRTFWHSSTRALSPFHISPFCLLPSLPSASTRRTRGGRRGRREWDVGSGTPNLGCSHPVLQPGQPGDRTRRGHEGARPGDRSPSQQGASLQGLAEGRDLSRFVWVGIKEVGIKERQKAVLQQQRSPRASGGSSKKV